MSEEQADQVIAEGDAPVEGSTVEAAAEQLAAEDGFPAKLADGTVIRLVGKEGPYSLDADGTKYVADPVHDYVVPADAA